MVDIAKIEEFLQKNWKFILILTVLLICAMIMMSSLSLMGHRVPVVVIEVGDGNTGNWIVNVGESCFQQLVIIGDDILKWLGEIFK